MDLKNLKKYIYENKKVEYILEQIGCKNISDHGNYYSCANYNGDNPKAICQYYDSEYLNCENYTRDILPKNSNNTPSLIDLVCYNKNLNLFKAAKYLCDILGIDYYEEQNEEDLPESIKMIQMLYDMQSGDYIEDDVKLKPINEKVLTYYKPYVNEMFYKDGIFYDIQKEFEIGYDQSTNCITIPIRDEIGNLVGVKGRFFDYNLTENKYIALERYAKSKILYGLYMSMSYIKKAGKVFVGESEKFVMQLYSMGYYNCVSTGGSKISKAQKNKLASLGVDIIFCYDKDILKEKLEKITEDFTLVKTYAIIDNDGILNEKESPSDNKEKWEHLVKNNIYAI